MENKYAPSLFFDEYLEGVHRLMASKDFYGPVNISSDKQRIKDFEDLKI